MSVVEVIDQETGELSEEQRFQFKQLLRLLQEKQCEP